VPGGPAPLALDAGDSRTDDARPAAPRPAFDGLPEREAVALDVSLRDDEERSDPPAPRGDEPAVGRAVDLLSDLAPATFDGRPRRHDEVALAPSRLAVDVPGGAERLPAPRALASLDVAPPPRVDVEPPPKIDRVLEHTPYKNRF